MRFHARRLVLLVALLFLALSVKRHVQQLGVNLAGFVANGLRSASISLEDPLRGQVLVDYIANHLSVKYSARHSDGRLFIGLTNTGPAVIPADNWTIYFSIAEALNRVAETRFHSVEETRVIIRHLDGWLFSMEPVVSEYSWVSFKPLKPYETLFVNHEIHLKSKSYAIPGWYVSGNGLKPKVIRSTAHGQLKIELKHRPLDPGDLYSENKVLDLRRAAKAIIPTPLMYEHGSGEIKLDAKWTIVSEKEFHLEAGFISDRLNLTVFTPAEAKSTKKKIISLALKDLDTLFSNFTHITKSSKAEGYHIGITSDRISITGQTPTGIFYGVQSLLSLLDNSKDRRSLPVGQIADAPRLEFRGLLLDVARNYIPKQKILQTLDIMAMYKLNKLHLHLSDDQGWRIEIPSLPELTEIGSQRSHDLKEEQSLLPHFGSHPAFNRLLLQYYSVDDYQEILRHAKSRHVEIIPEIDMPGHSHAAIQSMRMRYYRLLKNGIDNATASKFLLHDLSDTSSYLAVSNHRDTVINPCLESTYLFIEEVVRTLVTLHQVVQPLKTVHFGGDEVPQGALQRSPVCATLRKETSEPLPFYFMKRVTKIAGKFGVRFQAWEDCLHRSPEPVVEAVDFQTKEGIVINSWRKGIPIFKLANAGYKIVLSHANSLYLDHPYEADVEERGLFWAARSISTHRIFSFMFSGCAGSAPLLRKRVLELLGMSDCKDLQHPENIIGIQANLWGEMIKNMDDIDYMVFPRLLAVAERAWHLANWETVSTNGEMLLKYTADWTDFANTVGYKELERLERLGINYRLSTPGFKVIADAVDVNTEFPGSIIQYSTDGGNTWTGYSDADGEKLNTFDHVQFSVVSHDLKRRGRIVSKTNS